MTFYYVRHGRWARQRQVKIKGRGKKKVAQRIRQNCQQAERKRSSFDDESSPVAGKAGRRSVSELLAFPDVELKVQGK